MIRRAASSSQLELFDPFGSLEPARDPPSSFPPLPPLTHRWRFSRPALASKHLGRIQRRLEIVRRHFPELDGVTIRVGLARARGVLGWGSLDAEHPGIWVRPRRCDLFTITHEMTHLLQARRLVPGGELTCDLYALARSPHLIDCEPSYLHVPIAWVWERRLVPSAAEWLCLTAREAIDAHPGRPRRAIGQFRRAVAVMSLDPTVLRDRGDPATIFAAPEITF